MFSLYLSKYLAVRVLKKLKIFFFNKQCTVPILGVKFFGFVMAHFLVRSWCTSSHWADFDILLEKKMVAASIL